MTVSYRVAAVSGGASAQLNRATRRARVRSSGMPLTSLGQAKKSDSNTPCNPVAWCSSRPWSRSAGLVSARRRMSMPKDACTTMPMTAPR